MIYSAAPFLIVAVPLTGRMLLRHWSARSKRTARIQALLDSLLESASECIAAIDERNKVAMWNSAAERAFGHSRSEAVGAPLPELILPPELRFQYYRAMERYFRIGDESFVGKQLRLTGMRQDGSRFAMELQVNPLRVHGQLLFTAFMREASTEQGRFDDAADHREPNRDPLHSFDVSYSHMPQHRPPERPGVVRTNF